jgi:hypothetical protein
MCIEWVYVYLSSQKCSIWSPISLCTKREVISKRLTQYGWKKTKIKTDSLHFNLIVIVSSFQIQRAGVQSQNNKKCVTM